MSGSTDRRHRTARRRSGGALRLRLVLADIAALAAAAGLTSLIIPRGSGAEAWPVAEAAVVAASVGAGLAFAWWNRLYRASQSSVRSAEYAAILRVAVLLALTDLVAQHLVVEVARPARAVLLVTLTALTLTTSRSLFHSWLRARRSHGEFLRPVVIVGASRDTARIVRVLHDHRESGFVVAGVCSDSTDALGAGLRAHWVGEVDDAAEMVRRSEATGAIVVANALDTATLNRVVREVADAGGHVHISSGLHGLSTDRILSEPIAHEPLLHIHPTRLDPRQEVLKRALDVAMSSVMLLVTAPLLLATMAAIRLSDGGPALFRQVRVGRGGRHFEVLKLRTMEVGAEERLEELASANERSGPLFKLDHDPRVTRLGRLLRASSIDELPQLWNVVRGDMSLVGPRPALPSEVEAFPPDLTRRTDVLPGVTGLWQVEARDNPSFEAYARLDLFYVENWTLTFDLVILLATVESEVARVLTRLLRPDEAVIDLRPVAPAAPVEATAERSEPYPSTQTSTLVD